MKAEKPCGSVKGYKLWDLSLNPGSNTYLWASYLTSLRLSFHDCKMGITIPTLQAYCKDRGETGTQPTQGGEWELLWSKHSLSPSALCLL